jgi:hypothetical protein
MYMEIIGMAGFPAVHLECIDLLRITSPKSIGFMELQGLQLYSRRCLSERACSRIWILFLRVIRVLD